MVRSVGILGVTLVAYGVAISATRMPVVSTAFTAAVAGIGLAWAIFAE